jgi:hypothetical protein
MLEEADAWTVTSEVRMSVMTSPNARVLRVSPPSV